ncbi:hypothetical protein CDD83_5980 [Cordyceps sp. RAO-2017]|nr:hypothetical protein CDD83_5980 [Cordyceps sp. RAO-2017]
MKSTADFTQALRGNARVVVDCSAEWCGPCKAISPVFQRLSELPDLKHVVHFAKFDVDAVPELARDLDVRAMPTFLFFKGGERFDELVGADPTHLKDRVTKLATAFIK